MSGTGGVSAWSDGHQVVVHGAKARSYGRGESDDALSAALTADGGVITAGLTYSQSFSSWNVWLVRTNGAGDSLWTRTYGGNADDVGGSVAQTSDGGFVLAGWTEVSQQSSGDLLLMRMDAVGDTLWTRRIGGPRSENGSSIQQTQDGGFIVAGTTRSTSDQKGDLWLVRTDMNGETLWTRTFGTAAGEDGNSVRQTTDGGFVVAGIAWSWDGMKSSALLVRTDADGNELWTRTYGGGYRDGASAVRQTPGGGYVIVGTTEASQLVSADLLLIKTDASGNVEWQKALGRPGWQHGHSIEATSDGGYIVAGYANPFTGSHDGAWLAKVDAAGDITWDAVFGGPGFADGVAAFEAPGGGYLMAGSHYPDTTNVSNVWVIKTDAVGR